MFVLDSIGSFVDISQVFLLGDFREELKKLTFR